MKAPYRFIGPAHSNPRPAPAPARESSVAPDPPPAPAPAPAHPAVHAFNAKIPKGSIEWIMHPYWRGETVFVVASGPSIATTNFELIRGRKIIVVNSAYEKVPFASMLYFGDGRWWKEHRKRILKSNFAGHIVTCSGIVHDLRLLKIKRLKPSGPETGFHFGRDGVASQRTSLQGAMNIAAHLSSDDNVKGKIVLLGADMGRDPKTGASHGHTPHKWPNRPGNVTWDEQLRHLKWIVSPLKRLGIPVVNCGMYSRIPWFPKMTLEAYLAQEKP